MYGTYIKMAEAQQARVCNKHKNIKLKLIKGVNIIQGDQED
jgi:hypothetical protein